MERGAPGSAPVVVRSRAFPVGLILWVVAAGVAVQSLADYLRRPLYDRQVDLHVYITAVSSFVHGASLYGLHGSLRAGFTYPPFAGLAMLPLAPLPESLARVAWTLLTVGATAGIALIAARRLPRRLGPVAAVWPALTALLLVSKPLQSNLRFGQVSIFLTLAVLADATVLDARRVQGVLTGLAAAVKLTPLLFIPYLWITGRRRAAAIATAWFAGATALAAAILPHDSWAFWSRYLWHESQGLPLAETGNQSIYGVLLRAGLHGGTLTILWLGLAAAAAVLGLWRARRAWLANQSLLSVAIAGCVSILVSPISWTHHEVWILLAAAGVFTASASVDLAISAVLVVPMVIGLPGVHVLGPPGRWLADNHRAVLAALAACVLPFAVLPERAAIRGSPPGAGSPGPPPASPLRTAGTRRGPT